MRFLSLSHTVLDPTFQIGYKTSENNGTHTIVPKSAHSFRSELKQCGLLGRIVLQFVCVRYFSDTSFLIWHVGSETMCDKLYKICILRCFQTSWNVHIFWLCCKVTRERTQFVCQQTYSVDDRTPIIRYNGFVTSLVFFFL